MNFITNNFSGLVIIKPKIFKDSRGYFYESYKESEFNKAGIKDRFVQDNQSFSHYGVVRGLHFQVGSSKQSKLVRCLSGEIYDVALDLREGSKTFGNYFGIKLSDKNQTMLYIPEGFAHGFSVLSETAEISYKVSHEYDAESESGIRFDDKDLKIDWKVNNPIVSEKDLKLPVLKDSKISF